MGQPPIPRPMFGHRCWCGSTMESVPVARCSDPECETRKPKSRRPTKIVLDDLESAVVVKSYASGDVLRAYERFYEVIASEWHLLGAMTSDAWERIEEAKRELEKVIG